MRAMRFNLALRRLQVTLLKQMLQRLHYILPKEEAEEEEKEAAEEEEEEEEEEYYGETLQVHWSRGPLSPLASHSPSWHQIIHLSYCITIMTQRWSCTSCDSNIRRSITHGDNEDESKYLPHTQTKSLGKVGLYENIQSKSHLPGSHTFRDPSCWWKAWPLLDCSLPCLTHACLNWRNPSQPM